MFKLHLFDGRRRLFADFTGLTEQILLIIQNLESVLFSVDSDRCNIILMTLIKIYLHMPIHLYRIYVVVIGV